MVAVMAARMPKGVVPVLADARGLGTKAIVAVLVAMGAAAGVVCDHLEPGEMDCRLRYAQEARCWIPRVWT
jgi:hypothetical protein